MSCWFLAVIITILALAPGVSSPPLKRALYSENEDGRIAVPQIHRSASGEKYLTVTGRINSSIKLSISPNSLQKLPVRVIWKFRDQATKYKIKIADIKDNELQSNCPQFEGRLEGFENGTVLCIKDVTKADEGIYYADVALEDDEMRYFGCNLTLYEAAPTPSVKVTVRNPTDIQNVSIPAPETRLYYFLAICLLCSIFAVIGVICITYKREKSEYGPVRTDEEVKTSVEESNKPKSEHESNVIAERPESEVLKDHKKMYSPEFITLHPEKETATYHHVKQEEKCEDPHPEETNNVMDVSQMDEPIPHVAQQDDF